MNFRVSKIFISLTFLAGCAQLQVASRPKVIRGENCMESPRLKVMQVLDDGILAHLCPVDYPSYYDNAFDACTVKGDLVFMSVSPKANDYADNQKVTLADTQCFASDGTYSYLRSDEYKATVRKVKILEEDRNPPKGTNKTP